MHHPDHAVRPSLRAARWPLPLVVLALVALLAACSGSAVSEGGAANGAVASDGASGATDDTTGGAATGGAATTGGEPITIGLLIPTSGVYSLLGEDIRQGFELYLDGSGGTLGGRPVEVVEADEGENVETGVRAAQRLVNEQQVDAVVGVVSSAVALAVRDLFDERQVPLVIANAGANDITGERASQFIFRTSFSNSQISHAMGSYLAEQGVQNLFIIAPDYAGGHEHAGAVREGYEAGGGQVAGEVLPPFTTTQDYQPFLQQIRDSGAEAVWAFFSGGEAITFIQQYQQFGLKGVLPLYGPGFLTDGTVLSQQGPAAEGVRTSLHYTPLLENPTNQAFTEAYEDAYGELPTEYALAAYDAAQLLDLALADFEGAIRDNPEDFIAAMEGVGEIDSPRGVFSLSETHNPEQPLYLLEVQAGDDGELGNVVIEELGTVEEP